MNSESSNKNTYRVTDQISSKLHQTYFFIEATDILFEKVEFSMRLS